MITLDRFMGGAVESTDANPFQLLRKFRMWEFAVNPGYVSLPDANKLPAGGPHYILFADSGDLGVKTAFGEEQPTTFTLSSGNVGLLFVTFDCETLQRTWSMLQRTADITRLVLKGTGDETIDCDTIVDPGVACGVTCYKLTSSDPSSPKWSRSAWLSTKVGKTVQIQGYPGVDWSVTRSSEEECCTAYEDVVLPTDDGGDPPIVVGPPPTFPPTPLTPMFRLDPCKPDVEPPPPPPPGPDLMFCQGQIGTTDGPPAVPEYGGDPVTDTGHVLPGVIHIDAWEVDLGPGNNVNGDLDPNDAEGPGTTPTLIFHYQGGRGHYWSLQNGYIFDQIEDRWGQSVDFGWVGYVACRDREYYGYPSPEETGGDVQVIHEHVWPFYDKYEEYIFNQTMLEEPALERGVWENTYLKDRVHYFPVKMTPDGMYQDFAHRIGERPDRFWWFQYRGHYPGSVSGLFDRWYYFVKLYGDDSDIGNNTPIGTYQLAAVTKFDYFGTEVFDYTTYPMFPKTITLIDPSA